MSEEDLSDVFEIESECFKDAWSKEQIGSALKSSNQKIFILEDNGKITGFGVTMSVLDECEILRIAVRKQFRRNGMGSFLLQKMLDEGKENGTGIFYLEVRASNEPARKLYEKKGFPVEISFLGQYIADPEIAGKFEIFYRLYGGCRENYPMEEILSGKAGEDLIRRAKEAPFDERLAVLELIFDRLTADLEGGADPETVSLRLESAFHFIEAAWGQGQEISFFMTDLTMGKDTALFIARYGSPSYVKYSEKLMLYDRREALRSEIRGS